MEGVGIESDEKLVDALLPYLETFDESAISDLTKRLKVYGIDVYAAEGSNGGSSITFTKQGCPNRHATEPPPTNTTWDMFSGLLSTPDGPAFNQEDQTQTPGFSLDLFGAGPQLGMPMTDLFGFEGQPDDFGGVDGSGVENETRPTRGEETQQYHDPVQAMDSELIASVADGEMDDVARAAMADIALTPNYQQDDLNQLYALLGEVQGDTASDSSSSHQAGSRSTETGRSSASGGDWTEATELSDHGIVDQGGDDVVRADQAKRRSNEEESSTGLHGPLSVLHAQFGVGTTYNLSAKVLEEIWELSRDFIRPNLVEFLEEALPRWRSRGGLWLQEQPPQPLMQGTGRARLLTAYSCICKLEARMGDDQIRNRVAVIMLHSAYEQACKEWRTCTGSGGGGGSGGSGQGKGRGGRRRTARGRSDASSVIDDILERLHDDWQQSQRKVQLRNRFHDKKRYGKRWLILTRALGTSLLFACSPRIASVVQNTVFTVDMLAVLTFCVQHLHPAALQILDVLNRSAHLILGQGNGDDQIAPETILGELRPLCAD